ncbi:hypothetical protein [Leuconostoc sp. LN180020]|uniref:hypothetical protein n=1 Tax=Leuconostoc sp. LN180020 TaxID=2571156 RepID=UPI0017820870|nr:hypothetical protein [Leuconostoc sp. LN180020]QOG11012.1 hypothetical protein FAZ25_09230 [Leuconostoc sp. LN180020]
MYTVLDENLQVKGRLSLNNGQGNTTFFSDTITIQMATDNANDPAGLTTVDYTNQDKQGNAKQWSHTLTISVEATDLGTSINTTNYLMYFDSVADHYYLMKVINAGTDRNSGFITVSAINAAIFELGKQLIQAEQTLAQVDLKTFVSKMYKNVPFSLRVADDNLTVIDYVVSANTSLQALLQDLQTKYDVDVDSWVELDTTGRIVDRVLYFGHLGSDNGELVRYGGAKGFENMTATEVSDIIYTKLYVTGKTDDKDATKGHIGTVNNGLEYITDDDANQLMYAIGASQQQPVYLEGTITNSLLSEPKALLEWAKQQIGIFNHPRFNYTVSPLHDQIVALGDTVTVQDFHIKPEILVTSKVIQKTVSFASPETNTFVLGEFSSIFTDNMNKSANVINLIKKDVTVTQEAAQQAADKAELARQQADAAHNEAVKAQADAYNAQVSADGKAVILTVTSLDQLPQTAKEGTQAWYDAANGTYLYVFLDGKWVKRIDPDMATNIENGVNQAINQAKDYSDKAIADNQVKVDASIKSVDDKANQLKQDQSALDTKAQGYANQAKADAEANAAAIQQQLQKAISDGDTGLQSQITSNKDAIALTATKTELNDAKTDYNAQISSLNVKADGITQTVTQVSDKVDNLQVGGRNYVLSSTGMGASNSNRPNVAGVNKTVITNAAFTYDTDGITLTVSNPSSEWFYSLINAWTSLSDTPMLPGKTYTISVDAMGTVPGISFRLNDAWVGFNPINNSTWTRVSATFTNAGDATRTYIRINAATGSTGASNFTAGQTMRLRNFKLEDGNTTTAWTPAPEDTDSKFSQQQQTIDSINSTVQQQGTNINNVSTRVQTAEGNISTVQNNITGLQSSQKQTADGLSQEVSDRKSGDSTVLQQGKDFTTSQVSNSETNMKSLINQKADSATVGVIQNDVTTLKANTQWERKERFDDMNFLTQSGRFFIGASAGTNSAVSASFYIMVDAPQADRITQTQWKDLDGSLMYRRTYNGSSWTPWAQMVMSSTLLNIFHDSWSLGTSTNDGITKQLITGINGQADGTLVLSGKSIVLNSQTIKGNDFIIGSANIANGAIGTAQIGDAAITSAKIASLDARKITTGQLSGPSLNIDLDQGNVFFQKGRIYDSKTQIDVNIDQAYIRTTNGGGSATLQNGRLLLTGPVYNNGQTIDSNPYFSVSASLLPTFSNQPDGAVGSLLESKDFSEISVNGHGNIGFLANMAAERGAGIGISAVTGTYIAGNDQGVILSGGKDIGGVVTAESPNFVVGYDDSKGVDGKDVGGNSILARANNFVVAANNFSIDKNGNGKVSNGFFARNIGTNGYHTITSQDNGRLYFSGGNSNLIDISVKTVSQSSLVSLKENIRDIDPEYALAEVLKSDVRQYNFIGESKDNIRVSPMIDDVNHELYIPKDWLAEDGKSVENYTITGYLIQSIKALQQEIKELKQG